MNSPIILVLPGGGYQNHAPHEGEPVAQWLRDLGWRARVVEYPVSTRHPGPVDFVRAEIKAERDAGASAVGIIGFSAGGHLAGHIAATGGVEFAILCYPVDSMQLPTHAGSRRNLLGGHPAPWTRRALSVDRMVIPRRRRSSSGTPSRTTSYRSSTPTRWRGRSPRTGCRTSCTCSARAGTGSGSAMACRRPSGARCVRRGWGG